MCGSSFVSRVVFASCVLVQPRNHAGVTTIMINSCFFIVLFHGFGRLYVLSYSGGETVCVWLGRSGAEPGRVRPGKAGRSKGARSFMDTFITHRRLYELPVGLNRRRRKVHGMYRWDSTRVNHKCGPPLVFPSRS